jgi:hypothetical protein
MKKSDRDFCERAAEVLSEAHAQRVKQEVKERQERRRNRTYVIEDILQSEEPMNQKTKDFLLSLFIEDWNDTEE